MMTAQYRGGFLLVEEIVLSTVRDYCKGMTTREDMERWVLDTNVDFVFYARFLGVTTQGLRNYVLKQMTKHDNQTLKPHDLNRIKIKRV